jgi:hypothetical protein
MHPELSDNKLFFIYPAEFQLTYFYRNTENPYLFSFKPCVLTDMQVDYGGDQFSTFANGAPVEVNISLTFRETEILTKESFKPKPKSDTTSTTNTFQGQFGGPGGELSPIIPGSDLPLSA